MWFRDSVKNVEIVLISISVKLSSWQRRERERSVTVGSEQAGGSEEAKLAGKLLSQVGRGDRGQQL